MTSVEIELYRSTGYWGDVIWADTPLGLVGPCTSKEQAIADAEKILNRNA